MSLCSYCTMAYSEFPAYGADVKSASRSLAGVGTKFIYVTTAVNFIVTAAVHQGLSSSRKALPLTFWHWASVAPYTSPYGFAESCVFDKQSPGIFHCGFSPRITVKSYENRSKAYPEVTPAVLPSSLRGYHPITLEYSSYPPALVCGTVTFFSRNEHFLGS